VLLVGALVVAVDRVLDVLAVGPARLAQKVRNISRHE
jgi:hypothetical protein